MDHEVFENGLLPALVIINCRFVIALRSYSAVLLRQYPGFHSKGGRLRGGRTGQLLWHGLPDRTAYLGSLLTTSPSLATSQWKRTGLP